MQISRHFRAQKSFAYIYDVPIAMLSDLHSFTGHNHNQATAVITLSLEYGANFSKPGGEEQ